MFDDIQELENEIQSFKKNILASENLILGFERVTEAIKKQGDECCNSYNDVIDKLREYSENLKLEQEKAISETHENIKAIMDCSVSSIAKSEKAYENICQKMIESITASSAEQQQAIVTQVDELNRRGEVAIANAVTEIENTQQKYMARIDEMEKALNEGKTTLLSKYEQFINKLDSTNVDQIYQECKNIKKTLTVKLTAAYIGIGVIGVLTIISLIIR